MRTALAFLALGACCGLSSPAGDDGRAKQLLVITIDTEALRDRAPNDHVKRLIWGDFGDGEHEGIDQMMDAADAHGAKLSFFLDVLEEHTYPGQLEEVAKHIEARGHDVELHTHAEQMTPDFWTSIGVTATPEYDFTASDAQAVLGDELAMLEAWGIPAPVGYRAGGYNYSAGVVEALPGLGFGEDYDYNIVGASQPKAAAKGEMPVFQWDNGLVEVPISYVDHCGKPDRFDDFTWIKEGMDVAYDDIRRYQDEHPHGALVLMLHSWSLLDVDKRDNYFVYSGDWRRQALDDFLGGLPDFVEVVSAHELHDRIAAGDVTIDDTENVADLF